MGDPVRVADVPLPPSLAEKLARYDAAVAAVQADIDSHRETDEEAAERRAVAHAHRVARWEERRPLMYADAATADIEDARVVEWLGRIDSHTLVLAGAVGVGKTHAAYAIGNQAVQVGLWVEAWTVTDLLEDLRPSGAGASGVRECDLLVLDDLGAQTATPWAVETLTSVLDARIREGRRQIVTTNAPYDALVETWGTRLMDRLAYRMVAVALEGQSRRRAAW